MQMLLPRLSAALKAHPLKAAIASATVKTTTADVMVQTVVEGRSLSELDRRRTAVFTLFGGLWMGAGQYLLYCRVFEALLPAKSAGASLGKMFLDQGVHVPLVYFPIFYSIDALLQEADDVIAHVQTKVRTELASSLKANWSLWLPASFVGFRFVPTHWRIPYVSAVSMVWTTAFSCMQGRFRAEEAAMRERGGDLIEGAAAIAPAPAPS